MHNFHCHTFLSDGVLSPIELLRRCEALGYRTVALTDHIGVGGMARLLDTISEDCELASAHFALDALSGVELTHVPPSAIPALARRARELGARIVVVHGETLVEPVPPGTNAATVRCPDVDILAHPGLLSLEDARAAKENGVLVEITSRAGHSLANGHVVRAVREAGGQWVLNTDAHGPSDLIGAAFAERVLTAAGLSADEVQSVMVESPQELRRRAGLG
jgi:histidinol phosphatase-like PHP family hydrolase